MSTLSAIVVGHDSRPSLDRALASIDGSSDDLELILVDNASTDGTAEHVRACFPRCRVIESGENLGFGRACNLGARETTGEHILLVNPDAWVDPSCVDRLCKAMESDPRLGWAAPGLCYPDGRLQLIWEPTVSILGEAIRRLRNRFETRRWAHDLVPRAARALGDPGWFSAACALVRRRAWEQVEGFDPGFFLYFEDADLCRRLSQAGWGVAQVADAPAYHDRHAVTASSDRLVHSRESQLRYYRKHRPRWESRVVLRKQMRALSNLADEAMRARLLTVLERGRRAFEAGVVDLPDGGALDQRSGVAAPWEAPAARPRS